MKLYTLEEAARIRLRRDHATFGHQWDEIKNGWGETIQLVCTCGAHAEVKYTKLPEGRDVSDD